MRCAILLCHTSFIARHAKTLLSTEEDKVEAQNRLYSALETQSAKPRHDGASTIADARKDTETFAVANFVFRRRDALRWFVELEAQFEAGVYSRPRRVCLCPRRSAASPTGTSRR